MRFTHEIEIDAPAERVFALIDDDSATRRWMRGLEETIYPDGPEQEHRVGTRFRQRIREGSRIADYEGMITVFDPPRRLGVRIGAGDGMTMRVEYRLEAIGGRTRVSYETEMEDAGWFVRALARLTSRYMRGVLEGQLVALRRLAEDRATPHVVLAYTVPSYQPLAPRVHQR